VQRATRLNATSQARLDSVRENLEVRYLSEVESSENVVTKREFPFTIFESLFVTDLIDH